MNRAIKFRAWNGSRMIKPSSIIDGRAAIIKSCDNEKSMTDSEGVNYYCDWDVDKVTDYPLMQFTGLQDKNGTDIYEGDIVVNEVVEEIYTVKFGAYGYTDTVGFHCVGHPDDPHSFYGGMGDVSYLTVIGNIHENPELFEVSK